MNRTPAGVPAAGGESERPAGAGTPPACEVFFVGVPVVSLVPRSTTGYKLASLRDEESCRRCRHEPVDSPKRWVIPGSQLIENPRNPRNPRFSKSYPNFAKKCQHSPLAPTSATTTRMRWLLMASAPIPPHPRSCRLSKSSKPRIPGFSSSLSTTQCRIRLHPVTENFPSCPTRHGRGIFVLDVTHSAAMG